MTEMPEEIGMRAVLFADGAKGYYLQTWRNEEWGVTCTVVRESHKHKPQQSQAQGSVFIYQTMRDGIRGHFVSIGITPTPVSSHHEFADYEGDSWADVTIRAIVDSGVLND